MHYCRCSLKCRYFLLFTSFFAIKIIFFSSFYSKNKLPNPRFLVSENVQQSHQSRCYRSSNIERPIDYFEDILDDQKQPESGKAIFFHETTCSTTGVVSLNAKQACAIESAALHNRNHDVYVLFASPVGIKRNESLPQFYDKLRMYPNIHMRNMNLWRYSIGTPINEWMKTNQLFESNYLFEHIADIFRMVTLHKFGGYCMDLDVVVQKNIDDLGENFIGNDWGSVVNTAFLHLNNHGIGKRILQQYFRRIVQHFDGTNFIANGPQALTHIFEDICKKTNRTLWTQKQCSGLTVYPKEYFYSVPWTNYSMFFDTENLNETVELMKNSYLIHVWNDKSKTIWHKVGTKNAYQFAAKIHCPHVYGDSDYL